MSTFARAAIEAAAETRDARDLETLRARLVGAWAHRRRNPSRTNSERLARAEQEYFRAMEVRHES